MSDPHIQRLRRLDVCAVSDALDKLGLPGAVTGLPLRSAGPGGNSRIAGRAVTMKVGPGQPPPGPPKHLGCTAIEQAGPDNIIVVEQRSGLEAGCWGGLLTLGAKVRGVAGVVADGPLRVEIAPEVGGALAGFWSLTAGGGRIDWLRPASAAALARREVLARVRQDRSAREVSGPLRSSQSTRSVQRRPSRSSSTMIGRPVLEPRTFFTIYFTPLLHFL